MDWAYIYSIFFANTKEQTFCSAAHKNFFKIDYILRQKKSLQIQKDWNYPIFSFTTMQKNLKIDSKNNKTLF